MHILHCNNFCEAWCCHISGSFTSLIPLVQDLLLPIVRKNAVGLGKLVGSTHSVVTQRTHFSRAGNPSKSKQTSIECRYDSMNSRISPVGYPKEEVQHFPDLVTAKIWWWGSRFWGDAPDKFLGSVFLISSIGVVTSYIHWLYLQKRRRPFSLSILNSLFMIF